MESNRILEHAAGNARLFQLLDYAENVCSLTSDYGEAIDSKTFRVLDATFPQKRFQILGGSDFSYHCQLGDAAWMRFKARAGKASTTIRRKAVSVYQLASRWSSV